MKYGKKAKIQILITCAKRKLAQFNLLKRVVTDIKKESYYISSKIKMKNTIKNDKKITYNDIYGLIYHNANYYFNILNEYQQEAIKSLSKKSTINVAFLVYCSSIWQYDEVYKMMDKDDKFNPFIILVCLNDGNSITIREQYDKSKRWYLENGYNVVPTCYDDYDPKRNWNTLSFDIIFTAIPYNNILPKEMDYANAGMQTLLCYMPYGVAINEMSERYFDLKIHNMAWKLFYETELHKNIAMKNSKNHGNNVIVTGYAKMDTLVKYENENKKIDVNKIWSIPDGVDEKKILKIIYAPHHSLTRSQSKYSTFDENAWFILDLAKRYKDTTSWIFKPHPLLKRGCVEIGMFSNEEYDDYVNQWNELPNGHSVLEGDYKDVFYSSDTMIMDSESFLLEYQYTHNPLCFLRCPTQTFNEFGKELLKCVYCIDGDDYSCIEKFINQLMKKQDPKKSLRDDFFMKYLNYYYNNNQKYASNYIIDELSRNIWI